MKLLNVSANDGSGNFVSFGSFIRTDNILKDCIKCIKIIIHLYLNIIEVPEFRALGPSTA